MPLEESTRQYCTSNDVDDSKVIEDVQVPFKTTSITEDVSVGSDTPIIDEGHIFYENISEVVDAIVEFGTPLIVDAHIYDTSYSAPELLGSSIYTQIFRYSFATSLIGETVDSNIITSSGPSESPRADYDFMIIPTASFSSESSQFFAMI